MVLPTKPESKADRAADFKAACKDAKAKIIRRLGDGGLGQLYRDMGFKPVGQVNDAGWHSLIDPDGKSGHFSYSATTGYLKDHRRTGQKPISLFDAMAKYGHYRSFNEAIQALADRFDIPLPGGCGRSATTTATHTPITLPPGKGNGSSPDRGAVRGTAGTAVNWPARAAAAVNSYVRDNVLTWLSAELGVGIEALKALAAGATVNRRDGQWVAAWPLWDGGGVVVGQETRSRDGKKRLQRGGKHGLFYCKKTFFGGPPLTGHVFVPEGASCTAAFIDMHVRQVVGRSMKNCGDNIRQLADLFQKNPDAEIVIVGENDKKPDKRWPGREGAEHTAEKLAKLLDRPVRVALPPPDTKDTREWLQQRLRQGATDLAALGVEYVELLLKDAYIFWPPAARPPQEPEPPAPPPEPPPPGPDGLWEPEALAHPGEVPWCPSQFCPEYYKPSCPTQQHPVLRRVDDHQELWFPDVDCRCLCCPHCGWHARWRWGEHLFRVIAQAAGMLWRFTVTREEWDKRVYDRLQGRRASYVTLRLPCGDLLVYATVPPVQGREKPLELGPATEMPAGEAALDAARAAVESPLSCGKSFIHASHAWRPCWDGWKDCAPAHGYERIGSIDDDASEVLAAARRDGLPSEGRCHDEGPDPCERVDPGRGYNAAAEAEIAAGRQGGITYSTTVHFIPRDEWDEARIHSWVGQFQLRVIDDEAAYGEPQPGDIDFPPPRPPSQPATTRLRRVNGGT
jgi:hypothetical protein